MKIKVDINTVNRIIDPKFPIEKLYKQLKGLSDKTGLIFAEPSAGSGQLHWTLDGEGWTAFTDLDDHLKPQASVLFNDRKNLLKQIVGNADLSDVLLTLPDEKFLFFRNIESLSEIGLTCWGYQYPYLNEGMQLETWVKKARLQEVAISFSWDGRKLVDYNFKFNSLQRRTDSDGIFLVDQSLPVGNKYTVEVFNGRSFMLTVIEGQKDYDFDLTEYFNVEISVKKDYEALTGIDLTLNFDNYNRQIKTDTTGHVSLRLPFECNEEGMVKIPQPDCVVICNDKTESLTPSEENNQLFYLFQFSSKIKDDVEEEVVLPPHPPVVVEEEKKPKPEIPQTIGITILDYGGYPVKEMEVTVILPKKKEVKYFTDENGRIEFPKALMSGKNGKIKVRFTATSEYQKTHDLHIHDKTKKETKQS